MNIKKEAYGALNPSYTLSYKYAIAGIDADQADTIENVDIIMQNAFHLAEEQIEKELYQKGFMICNAYLENIEYMRQNGNELVQAYIKELDKKYGGN